MVNVPQTRQPWTDQNTRNSCEIRMPFSSAARWEWSLRSPPSLGYNGRTTRVLGPLRVKGDPATGLMEVGVMVKTYSLLVARLVA